jgi:FkbM family methyltransferase
MVKISDKVPANLFCKMINIRNKIRGKKHQLSVTPEAGIYRVSDGSSELFICRRNRHNRSKRGVTAGIEELARHYHLDLLNLGAGDLLIDCGANIGELGAWALRHGLSYEAFEPERLEATCVDLNAFGGVSRTRRHALWNEDTTLKFFRKPGTADGSLIEFNEYDDVLEIPAKRLDNLGIDLKSGRRVVLKIEAEGAEPEVLEGASGILSHIDYVTIDCGFERGKERADTFAATNTYLVDHGFRMVKPNFTRMIMLYRNTTRTPQLD